VIESAIAIILYMAALLILFPTHEYNAGSGTRTHESKDIS